MSVLAWGNGTGEASYALVNVLATVDAKQGVAASNWNHYSNPAIGKALDRLHRSIRRRQARSDSA